MPCFPGLFVFSVGMEVERDSQINEVLEFPGFKNGLVGEGERELAI